MTASYLSIVLIGFALCVAIAVVVLIVRPRAAPGTALVPGQRSALWALVLVATVPLGVFTTMMGAGILSLLVGRCGLWECYPNRSLADLDFSLPTLGLGFGLCAVIFAVWWLALLPSPIPRDPTVRRTIRLVVASIATLAPAAHAVYGLS